MGAKRAKKSGERERSGEWVWLEREVEGGAGVTKIGFERRAEILPLLLRSHALLTFNMLASRPRPDFTYCIYCIYCISQWRQC